MAENITISPATKRCAVVTGANKGIGLEICRQLAFNGVSVLLTARDEKRGSEATDNLKESGISDVVFHQLDVTDPASIASLADFIKTHFGKLDILVNNAGIAGSMVDTNTFRGLRPSSDGQLVNQEDWKPKAIETYELAEECMKINYYGAKGMIKTLIPLLQLSNSPRIVNVSSSAGKLKYIPNEGIREMLNEVDSLTEERLDEFLNGFLKDFKNNVLEINGWPSNLSAYRVSKAALNAYTRILAKKLPSFCINCLCPGYVKTDINCNTGFLTVEEGAEMPVKLALLPDGGPSGLFFDRKGVTSFD